MKSLFVIITLLFLSVSSFGQGLCRGVFAETLFESHHLIQETKLNFSTDQDVLLVKAKAHQSWGDFRETSDMPGDVRLGASFIPKTLRNIFGLKAFNQQGKEVEALSEETTYLQLPTGKRVHRALQELERQVRSEDSNFRLINFYETGSDHVAKLEYLKNFALKSELPLSAEGALFEHDLNFHVYSSLVVPPQVSKALRIRAAIVLNFIDFVRTRKIPGIDAKALGDILEQEVMPDVVTRIDVGTGNLFVILVQMKTEPIQKLMNETAYDLELMFASQTSPKKYLVKMIELADLGGRADGLLKDYLQQLPEQWAQDDLTPQFLNNPAELYNDGLHHLKILEQAASKIATGKN